MKNELQQLITKQLDKVQLEKFELYLKAVEAYYDSTESLLSNEYFDNLEEELLELNVPELSKFIQSSIYRRETGLAFVDEYTQEMISLEKIKWKTKGTAIDIKVFFERKQRTYYESCKYDGASLKITWELNTSMPYIVSIISRGGINVTEKFRNHPDILATLLFRKRIIAGELLCKKQTFFELFSIDGPSGNEYENPRNFVGSLIKQKELSQSTIDALSFVACTDGINPLLENKNIWKEISFDSFYILEDSIKFFKSENFPYLCDGIVVAYLESGERRIKDNYPLNMVAIKFSNETADTTIMKFEWTQKKSGKLTPKALIKPVKLEGATMTKANCYNYQYMLEAHIGIGSIVSIEKSGDIIPIIAKVKTHSNNINMPDCEYIRRGKHLIAVDMTISRQYKFILGLKILKIDGIGDTLAEQIGNAVDFDIIELFNKEHKPKICEILGGGKKWQDFQELYNINSMPLDLLISILQFDQVGIVLSKKIALLLMKQSNDTANISGYVLANVARGEGFARITDSIRNMGSFGIKITKTLIDNDETITFEMTGNPPEMNKAEFEKLFKQRYPNSVHTTMKKDLKLLICDSVDSTKSKANFARKNNIKMVSYSEALNSKF